MNKHELLSKLIDLKSNIQNIFSRKKTYSIESTVEDFDQYLDDLPLTINRDPGPGITYYSTENSEFSRGQKKSVPKNIDSFAE